MSAACWWYQVGLYVRTTTAVSTTCQGYDPKPLYWRAIEVPLTFAATLSADVSTAAARTALDASVATWNAVDCAYLKLTDAGTTTTPMVGYQRSGPNTNVVTWLESGWPQSAAAIAATLTTFECGSGKLVDADVLFNGQGFTFSVAPLGQPATADIENTFTHELGHLVGFDHNPDPTSTMYAEAAAGEIAKRDTLGAGLERFGFVAVTGHGISADTLNDAYSLARQLRISPWEATSDDAP